MFTLTFFCASICGAAALAGGFIDAISGGGGLLTIPALLLTGVPAHIALGTNKVSACCGTAVALINFSSSHLVRWRMVLCGIGFSLIGSWLGSLVAIHMNSDLLGKIIVALLPLAMLGTLLPGKKESLPESLTGARFWVALPLICLIIGCYDGFFGPGTGSFLILALHWILRQGLIEASATAKAFNLGSNVSAAVSFIIHGAVYWSLGLLMAACFMVGNWLGSSVAIKIGAPVVRRFLLLSLLILLVSLVWRFFIAPG